MWKMYFKFGNRIAETRKLETKLCVRLRMKLYLRTTLLRYNYYWLSGFLISNEINVSFLWNESLVTKFCRIKFNLHCCWWLTLRLKNETISPILMSNSHERIGNSERWGNLSIETCSGCLKFNIWTLMLFGLVWWLSGESLRCENVNYTNFISIFILHLKCKMKIEMVLIVKLKNCGWKL